MPKAKRQTPKMAKLSKPPRRRGDSELRTREYLTTHEGGFAEESSLCMVATVTVPLFDALLEKISGKKLTLGNVLWSIRECEEESQAAFAKRLGLSRQYLCDLERNKMLCPMISPDYGI